MVPPVAGERRFGYFQAPKIAGADEGKWSMRVLAVVILLFGIAALALPAPAQVVPPPPWSPPQSAGNLQPTPSQVGPGQRHPGEYCTRHCRANETPCGRGCLPANGKICPAKVTTTCRGKP
jgi:hypothetical protein